MFSKKLKNCAYFFTCILPDYMAQDMLKEFLENSHFENTRARFPFEVSKSTLANSFLNDAFSGMEKNYSHK